MMTDMTKGNATKLILAFTVPILIGNLFQQLYSITQAQKCGLTYICHKTKEKWSAIKFQLQ